MNTDIRLSTDFWTHPKTAKLTKRAGLKGVRSLQILWIWTARNRPDGILRGLDGEDVEFAADWRGKKGVFLAAVTELGWLETGEDGGYVIHDWQDHNSWAAESDERGDKARFSRLSRENPEVARHLREQGVTAISRDEYQTYKTAVPTTVPTTVERPYNDRSTSVPTPAPAPAPAPALRIDTPPTPPRGDGAESAEPESEPDEPEPAPPTRAAPDCPHQAIIDLYHEALPECPRVRVWPETSRKQLAARWREDKARQNLNWWRDLFGQVAASDFLTGRAQTTDGRCFAASLTWLVKPSNLAKVLNGNYDNRAPTPGATTQPMTPRQRYMQDVANMIGTFEEAKRNGNYDLITFPAPTATSVDAPVRPVEPTRRALPGGGS